MILSKLVDPFAFASPADERAFHETRVAQFGRTTSVMIGVGIFSFIAYAGFDNNSTAREQLTAVRFYFIIPALGLMLWLSLVPRFRKYWELQAAVSAQIAHAGIVALLFLYEGTSPYGVSSTTYLLNVILLIITAVCLTPLSLRHALFICVVAEAVYALNLYRFSNLPVQTAASYVFNLGFIAFSCCFVAGSREWMLRRMFMEDMNIRNERNLLAVILSEIVPTEVALSIRNGTKVAPKAFGEVAILFSDLVGFTSLSGRIGPKHLVEILDKLFSRFDDIVEKQGLEKVKTIGDAYMVVGGARNECSDSVSATIQLGYLMIAETRKIANESGLPLDLRVGVHVGSVIGGVIGKTRMAFDYWGDAVNIASRMESNGKAGRIQVSEAVFLRLHGEFPIDEQRTLQLKGKGSMEAYLLAEQVPAAEAEVERKLHQAV